MRVQTVCPLGLLADSRNVGQKPLEARCLESCPIHVRGMKGSPRPFNIQEPVNEFVQV